MKIYRWFPICRWLALLIFAVLLVVIPGVLIGRITVATTRSMDYVAAGLYVLIMLGGLAIFTESFQLDDKGITWCVFWWSTVVRWEEIERLASERTYFIIRTTSILTNYQQPWKGKIISIIGFIEDQSGLETTVIDRARLVKIPQLSSWQRDIHDRI